ncbi:MAG: hypothetical protein ABIH86_03945 [Planctomycetota bacterium]
MSFKVELFRKSSESERKKFIIKDFFGNIPKYKDDLHLLDSAGGMSLFAMKHGLPGLQERIDAAKRNAA